MVVQRLCSPIYGGYFVHCVHFFRGLVPGLHRIATEVQPGMKKERRLAILSMGELISKHRDWNSYTPMNIDSGFLSNLFMMLNHRGK